MFLVIAKILIMTTRQNYNSIMSINNSTFLSPPPGM